MNPNTPTFNIGNAVYEMRLGNRVARTGWNGPDQSLELQVPGKNSKMTLPYIFIQTVQGDLVPWLASQTDILASDWYIVDAGEAEAVHFEPLAGNEEALSLTA